jgi:hypothetical protein
MKSNSFQDLVARILLVSLFLQSCGGGFDIPTGEGQIASVQTNTQLNIQPLVDKKFSAQGGHVVTFYEEAGQLKANIKINAPQDFSKSYEGLLVTVEQSAELAKLSYLDIKAQERRIYLKLAKGNQPARVVIYKGAGLVGGGKKKNQLTDEHTAKLKKGFANLKIVIKLANPFFLS